MSYSFDIKALRQPSDIINLTIMILVSVNILRWKYHVQYRKRVQSQHIRNELSLLGHQKMYIQAA